MVTWISKNITLPLSVTKAEERENAISHFIGFLLAAAGVLITFFSRPASGHPLAKTGMIIFALTNMVLYASSALYHFLKPGNAKKLLRVMDHSSIYILIAGSYTPILLYIGSDVTKRYAIGMWITAILGIILTIRFWGKFYALHIVLYVIMGWSVLIFYNSVFPFIPDGLFPYVLSGGLTYTAGLFFYGMKKIPHHHLFWHIFVLAGSLLFFIGFYQTLLA